MTERTDDQMARVEVGPDGGLVLIDPTAVGVMRAVGKHNCRLTADGARERIAYFVGRLVEHHDPAAAVITLINADDVNGVHVAEALMPGTDWSAFRARGETPYARGLAGRPGVQQIVDMLDRDEGDKLRELRVALVVIDHQTVAVFDATEWS